MRRAAVGWTLCIPALSGARTQMLAARKCSGHMIVEIMNFSVFKNEDLRSLVVVMPRHRAGSTWPK
jgi:hypothetical protein